MLNLTLGYAFWLDYMRDDQFFPDNDFWREPDGNDSNINALAVLGSSLEVIGINSYLLLEKIFCK